MLTSDQTYIGNHRLSTATARVRSLPLSSSNKYGICKRIQRNWAALGSYSLSPITCTPTNGLGSEQRLQLLF